MRFKNPYFDRKFLIPFGPLVIPSLSAVVSIALMLTFPAKVFVQLSFWILLGLFVYFCYGLRNSKIDRYNDSMIEFSSYSVNNNVKE
jgi:APA family basic amino acid/polyamine antiporter